MFKKSKVKKDEKKLVIRIDWGLGRVIAMTWAITAVAKTRPVKVVTSWPLVFWWNPYIESVHWLDDRDLYRNVIMWNDYFELEPYTDPEFFNDARNRLEIAAKQLAQFWWIIGWETPQPCLFLAEHEKINNTLEWNMPVLFQPFWSTMQLNWADKSYRSIPVEAAQYLALKLESMGFTMYEVIKPGAQPILDWCRILDTPDLRFVVSLCDRYPVLWCDSSLHHAAKAFNKKATVVWAGTDAERYGYESNNNLREFPMVMHTPLRLFLNSFNDDVSNQYTNKFTQEFLDKVIETFISSLQINENNNWVCKQQGCLWCR